MYLHGSDGVSSACYLQVEEKLLQILEQHSSCRGWECGACTARIFVERRERKWRGNVAVVVCVLERAGVGGRRSTEQVH
jgi:hypothetical protein